MIKSSQINSIVLACVSFVILNSCSKPTKEYVLKVKLNTLKEEDMYDTKVVKDVLFDAEELNLDSIKNKSRTSFLKGVDECKNKNKPAAAIKLFKQSILTFPDAKTYYELGNALLELKTNKASLEEAIKAYEVAEKLHIKPIYSVYYKLACANNMLEDLSEPADNNYYSYGVISYLRRAFHAGYSDTLAIEKDVRIKSIVSTIGYKSLLRELKIENQKGDKNKLFELYKAAFPIQLNGFEINLNDVAEYNNNESISYDFSSFVPEMQNTEFGREVSNDFFYVAMVQQTPAYSALIYSSISFWGDDQEGLMPSYTSLVTYDSNGIIIDRKLIACQCSAEKIKIAKISGNKIYVEDFNRIWKKPIYKVPFDENEINGHVSLAKLTYEIQEDGTILASEIPTNYTDTVITKNQSQSPPQ